jgi:hypothetical protein
MPVLRQDVLRLFVVVSFGVITSASFDRPARAACYFAPVKQQIDIVLDRDHERGTRFRREVASGSDSIAAMEALVSAEMREKIDICRYDVAEYLTKRGFPPFH